MLSREADALQALQDLFEHSGRKGVSQSAATALRSEASAFWLQEGPTLMDEFQLAMQSTILAAMPRYPKLIMESCGVISTCISRLLALYVSETFPDPLPFHVSLSFKALGTVISVITSNGPLSSRITRELVNSQCYARLLKAFRKAYTLDDLSVHVTLLMMMRLLQDDPQGLDIQFDNAGVMHSWVSVAGKCTVAKIATLTVIYSHPRPSQFPDIREMLNSAFHILCFMVRGR